MSRSDTFARTREALRAAGQTVAVARELTDVDTVHEARQVAASLTQGRFLDAWREVSA
jgi:hypothetical protein